MRCFFLSLWTFQITECVFQLRLTPSMRSGRRRSWSSGLAEAGKLWKTQDSGASITTPGKVHQEGKNSSLLSCRVRQFQQQKENPVVEQCSKVLFLLFSQSSWALLFFFQREATWSSRLQNAQGFPGDSECERNTSPPEGLQEINVPLPWAGDCLEQGWCSVLCP